MIYPFSIFNCEQRTPEWFRARAGRATASRAADWLAKIKTGEAASRRNYRAQLVAERLTGECQEDTYVNGDMQRGIDLEPEARQAYEVLTGDLVRQCGFVQVLGLDAGCSLDGYVGADVEKTGEFGCLVSIKCPRIATHLEYLAHRRLPPQYVPQATHEMWVTHAPWYDFVSYCPKLPENLQVFRVRVEQCEFDIARHEVDLLMFLAEVDEATQRFRNWK